MRSILNRKLVIAATALVMLAGAAVAVAATQSSSGSGEQAYINDLAGRLNVTPSALEAAIKAADSDQINAAVAAGRLTQTEANSLLQRIQQSTGVPFFGRGLSGRGFGGRGFGGLRGAAAVAAQYLGISESTLRTDLASGKSLAEIANNTTGKSATDLTTAIVNAETTRLNDAVSSGRITGAQETQLLTNLSSRISAQLQRTWTGGWTPGAGGWRGSGPAASGSTGLFGYQPTV
jgi:hypothetical protein